MERKKLLRFLPAPASGGGGIEPAIIRSETKHATYHTHTDLAELLFYITRMSPWLRGGFQPSCLTLYDTGCWFESAAAACLVIYGGRQR